MTLTGKAKFFIEYEIRDDGAEAFEDDPQPSRVAVQGRSSSEAFRKVLR